MNFKNPTAVLLKRLATSTSSGQGTLAALLTKFFADNSGKVTLPKTVADFALYQNAIVTTKTSIPFFGNLQYDPLNANWPASTFQLPQSEHALITGIALRDGASATLAATNWGVGITDAAAKNGYIDVLINGSKVITALPLTEFDNNALSTTVQGATDQSRGVFYLYEPLVLLGQMSISAVVTLPTASATANYNMRFEIKGVRFIGG